MSSFALPADGPAIGAPAGAPIARDRDSSWRSIAVAIAIAAAVAFAFHRLHAAFAFDTDDAYITYRYASNIATGVGFVYNAGERVLGTTTPLYTLLLASFAWCGVDIPRASAWINAACAGASLGLVLHWVRWRTGSWWAGLLGAAVLLSFTEFVLFSISGMETSLYLTLILLAFHAADRGWSKCAAVVAGLCVLVRMDGAAVGAALALHHVLAHRRLPPRGAALSFAITVLPWFVFAWWYFGDIRPQSMLAKHEHVLVADRFWLLQFLMQPAVVVFWPLCALGAAWAFRSARERPGLAGLALWTAAYATAYTAYRIDLYRWYLAPVTVAVAVLAMVGLGVTAAAVFGMREAEGRRVSWQGSLAMLLVVVPIVGLRGWATTAALRDAIVWTNTIEQSRADVADEVASRSAPGDVVATGAIGIVGWRTRLPIHDTLGLVTRGAVGQSLDANLKVSKARWCITETARRDEPAPRVDGFDLRGRFARHQDIAFLLFERTGAGAPGAVLAARAATAKLQTAAGLELEPGALTVDGLEVRITAERAVAKDYRVFAHVFRAGAGDGPVQVCDFDPPVPTGRLQPGAVCVARAVFQKPLQPGDVVRLGFFDERDPSFPRLADAGGRTCVEVECRQVAEASGSARGR